MKVINFGSMNIDYVYRVEEFIRPGETKWVEDLAVKCGGKGLNQSVALARAGAEVLHAAVVGPEGAFLVEKLRDSGVDVSAIRRVEASCGHAIIQVNARGQNSILVYPGTNALLTEDYVDQVLAAGEPGDLVLLQNETNLVREIIEKAAARGLGVALNAAPMDRRALKYPIEKLDWLFVNENEGEALSGEREPERMAVALRARCPKTEVVLTLGEEGSLYTGREGTFSLPARRVKAVDTTGAGDTFTGFCLRAVLLGLGARKALETATAASALAVTRPGAADSIPSWNEVKEKQ